MPESVHNVTASMDSRSAGTPWTRHSWRTTRDRAGLREDYRKVRAVSIKDLRRPRALASGRSRGISGGLTGFRAAALVLLASTSVSLAQVGDPGTGGDPIEETWRYLMDLFRMILGL